MTNRAGTGRLDAQGSATEQVSHRAGRSTPPAPRPSAVPVGTARRRGRPATRPRRPVKGITPAQLPTADSLSTLSVGQAITAVGYGANQVTNGPGGHTYIYDDVRMRSTGSLDAVNPSWLRVSQNPATGDAGACYGDSGGPNFLGTTDVIAATTITGDAICRATNVVYRLDTESARTFLSQAECDRPADALARAGHDCRFTS